MLTKKTKQKKQSFKQILADIKSLKIQGAQNVAVAAVKSLNSLVQEKKPSNVNELKKILGLGKKALFATRPTEPMMRNSLNFVLRDLPDNNLVEAMVQLQHNINDCLKFFYEADEKIVDFGSHKIRNGMVVFTHCHSSTVIKILKKAKSEGKNFIVHNTETRPRFQGRQTALDLAKAGIKVVHFVDSAARLALKKADLVLIGADAITTEGKVINKIGSELIAEVAERYDAPLYVCANSWKFDPKTIFGYEEEIEARSSEEVWPNMSKTKNIKINNFAFEKVNPDLVTGVITELGVFRPYILIEELKKRYPWMFERF